MSTQGSDLNDGYYFVYYARIEGFFKGEISNCMIHKTGDQIHYFGTEYWDRASQLFGKFKHIEINN